MDNLTPLLPTGTAGEAGKILFKLQGKVSFNTLKHEADAGTFPYPVGGAIYSAIRNKILEKAGYHGRKEQNNVPFLTPVWGCETILYKSTPPSNGDSMPDLLRLLGLEPSEITPLRPECTEFFERAKQVCVSLLPENIRGKEWGVFTKTTVMMNGRSSLDLGTYKAQVLHLDFELSILEGFRKAGIYPFVLEQALTREGFYLWCHETINVDDEATYDGKFLFNPMGAVTVIPGTMAHSGGFRSGPLGNQRLHYVFFLVEDNKMEEARKLIPQVFTQTYLGLEEGEVRHDFEIYNFMRDPTEDGSPYVKIEDLESRVDNPNKHPLYSRPLLQCFAREMDI
jgi:hypothetical protein